MSFVLPTMSASERARRDSQNAYASTSQAQLGATSTVASGFNAGSGEATRRTAGPNKGRRKGKGKGRMMMSAFSIPSLFFRRRDPSRAKLIAACSRLQSKSSTLSALRVSAGRVRHQHRRVGRLLNSSPSSIPLSPLLPNPSHPRTPRDLKSRPTRAWRGYRRRCGCRS